MFYFSNCIFEMFSKYALHASKIILYLQEFVSKYSFIMLNNYYTNEYKYIESYILYKNKNVPI